MPSVKGWVERRGTCPLPRVAFSSVFLCLRLALSPFLVPPWKPRLNSGCKSGLGIRQWASVSTLHYSPQTLPSLAASSGTEAGPGGEEAGLAKGLRSLQGGPLLKALSCSLAHSIEASVIFPSLSFFTDISASYWDTNYEHYLHLHRLQFP